MSSSGPVVKAAIFTALGTLYTSPTLVCYGQPGPYQPDEVVSVQDQRTEIARGPMATTRPREEVVETTIVFSVFRPGDSTEQKAATERAYALADLFSDYLRPKPNETLGGACREARVTTQVLAEFTVPLPDDPAQVVGVLSEITVTVTSTART